MSKRSTVNQYMKLQVYTKLPSYYFIRSFEQFFYFSFTQKLAPPFRAQTPTYCWFCKADISSSGAAFHQDENWAHMLRATLGRRAWESTRVWKIFPSLCSPFSGSLRSLMVAILRLFANEFVHPSIRIYDTTSGKVASSMWSGARQRLYDSRAQILHADAG
jgi:hypothetical protein